jgi:hypothetical protein
VTTRARDACNWARISALWMAVPIRSAKSHTLSSVSGGSGCAPADPTMSAHLVEPSTVTGAPTPDCSPIPRSRSDIEPFTPV